MGNWWYCGEVSDTWEKKSSYLKIDQCRVLFENQGKDLYSVTMRVLDPASMTDTCMVNDRHRRLRPLAPYIWWMMLLDLQCNCLPWNLPVCVSGGAEAGNLFVIIGCGMWGIALMAVAARSLHVAKVTSAAMAWRVARTGRAYPWCAWIESSRTIQCQRTHC